MSHVTNTDEISLQQYSKRKAQRDVQDYRATKHNEFYKCRFNNTASTNHKEMCKTIERLVEKRKTPLHKASECDIDDIKCLFRHGADMSAKDRDGKTLLHVASQGCCVSVVNCLLELGADVNATDERGNTPMHFISSRLKELEDYMPNGDNAYHAAESVAFEYSNEGSSTMRLLVEHGADVNIKCELGHTPLHLAMLFDSMPLLKCLVRHGADVNAKDGSGKPVLHTATNFGLDMVIFFVDHGADVNVTDENGRTTLQIALHSCHEDIVKYVVENGADVNVKDKGGMTPLHIAVCNCIADIVKCCVEHGADVNAKDELGRDALGITSSYTRFSGIEKRQIIQLLKNNAASAY